ncbi:phosphoglycerate dehydrogenase [Bordetella ansorpii]|uniref:Phosphoglycerate dehydrogenase n=1 Tax=Bordetella ansorpii TaxID=288768 RepID=A0A157SNG5_9BORD|nr:D-2-hydroxyacid dehydrogenase [Bordetella ansorpii]SAI71925.1 phosphoglycerate dehydrogenase [Bordetella ansorpii]
MKIVFLDRATLSPEIELRAPVFAHELVSHERTDAADVAGRIADADIVITNKARIGAEALARATRLKLVAVAATGTDNVDLAACAQRQVAVSNIRNYAVNTVPEHTFALIFALRRSILAYADSVAAGRWQESGQFCYFDFPIRDLAGSTLGIIGDGVLGNSVATIGRALGMRVLFSAHKGSSGMGSLYTPFERVLAESDIITLHCPLRPTTRNMIGAPEFAQMARKPLLINTARGGLVDEQALVDALRAGQIGGAGFDVCTAEPPAPDHPFMALASHPNFLLTPHVAWASREAMQGLADQLVDNIEGFVAGQPRNLVTPAR